MRRVKIICTKLKPHRDGLGVRTYVGGRPITQALDVQSSPLQLVLFAKSDDIQSEANRRRKIDRNTRTSGGTDAKVLGVGSIHTREEVHCG